jgi:hypothetical protein
MISKSSKQDILAEIEYAEARLQTMVTLNQADGAEGIRERIVKLKLKLNEFEQTEIQESPKKSVAMQTPSIATKMKEMATNILPKKEKGKAIKKETAQKAIGSQDFDTSLKISELFSKKSDFIFFQKNIRLMCARFRQFDNLKAKNDKDRQKYQKSLSALRDKCLKIIEHSVERVENKHTVKNTIYSSWIKHKTFTLNTFEDFLKELNIT